MTAAPRHPIASAPLFAAAAIRLLAVIISARTVADVERYRRVGEHVLDVSWNPYLAPRLYPYPPVWIWFEAGSLWLARQLGEGLFPVLVKLPVVAAEVALVAVLARLVAPELASRVAWLYALHPVAVLVSSFHGQFDSLMLLAVALALLALTDGHPDRSALWLALAIGLKSLPVLLLPLLLRERPGWPARLRYAALATLPVALALVPFARHDPAALARELFGYGGVADFGWIGALRGLQWALGGPLAPSLGRQWPLAVGAAKLLFLAAYAAGVAAFWRAGSRADVRTATQALFLGFLTLYGAVSAQYLLWAVPFGLVLAHSGARLRLGALAYGVSATAALLGFYAFLAPGVLWPASWTGSRPALAGELWTAGVVATLLAAAFGLLEVLRDPAAGQWKRTAVTWLSTK